MSEEDLAALLRQRGCRMLDMRDQIARMWKPIETAPRGVDLLLWVPPSPLLADIAKGHHEVGRLAYPMEVRATHWMPLPDPPE
jgi:hypothetical protein